MKKKYISSDIKLVFHSSTITMMRGPINIKNLSTFSCDIDIRFSLSTSSKRAFRTKVYGPYGGCKQLHKPVCSRNLDDVSERQIQNNSRREHICVTTYKMCISNLQNEQRHFECNNINNQLDATITIY